MAQTTINVGTTPNDGTGDALRVAFQACNANFSELYARALQVQTDWNAVSGPTSIANKPAATGTGSLVYQTAPTLTTPALGVATATSLNKVAVTAPATGATLTIADGKTLTVNSSLTLSGTDATTMTFPANTQTLAGLNIAQTFAQTQTLSPPANASAAVVSGYSLTGAATNAVFDLSGAWNTSGLPTALKLNITDTASNANSLLADLQIGGISKFSVRKDGFMTAGLGLLCGASAGLSYVNPGIVNATVSFGLGAVGAPDVWLSRGGAAAILLGQNDTAAPVAQTMQVQSVVAGTTNTAGTDWTKDGSRGTGTGAGGKQIYRVAPAGATGSAQNTQAVALTLHAPGINMQPSVVLGNQALATTATDGFLYVASGAGAPTGVPTAFAGRVPIYVDTTTSQFWMYLAGAWKQPKTPAGAAIVTWQ